MSLSGIGDPPLHEPILDRGERTPEHIVIGLEMPPRNSIQLTVRYHDVKIIF